MNKKVSKGRIFVTFCEAVGGLLSITATVLSLFIKDEEPTCPYIEASVKENKK